MKCYCYESEANFVFCVEDFEPELEANLKHAWFEKSEQKYCKKYSKNMEANGVTFWHKKIISENFKRLGPMMFRGEFKWEEIIPLLADQFNDAGIEWYIIGSIGDALRGINVIPHDIVVNTADFFKVRDLFSDFVVEPFVDNLDTWVVRYFGRLCIDGAMIDIAADEKKNLENGSYDLVGWNNYKIYVESFQSRYQTEIQRNRIDRIQAFEDFMEK